MRRETRDNVLMVILGIAFFADIIGINLFPPMVEVLVTVGWTAFGTGALLYVLSVVTLRRRGVSNLIDTGIYGVVRHPMYLGAMMMFFSHIFLGQNWIVVIGSVVAIVCCYLIVLSGEQRNIEKFGDDYKWYMKKVPRMNLFLGILRLLRRRRKQPQEENSNSTRDKDVE